MKETNQSYQLNHEEYNDEIDNKHNYHSNNPKQSEAYSIISTNDKCTENKIDAIDISHNTQTESLKSIHFEGEEPSIYSHFWYKKLGNCFAFLSNKNGDPIIIIGPHCI